MREAESTDLSFRTKLGTCTITPEHILLRYGREPMIGGLLIGPRSSLACALLIGGGILIFFAGVMIQSALLGQIGFLLFFAGLLLVPIALITGTTSANRIERKAVRTVAAFPPNSPHVAGYFVVSWESGGKLRKRNIVLPNIMNGGNEEWPTAVEVTKRAGLLGDHLPNVVD